MGVGAATGPEEGPSCWFVFPELGGTTGGLKEGSRTHPRQALTEVAPVTLAEAEGVEEDGERQCA